MGKPKMKNVTIAVLCSALLAGCGQQETTAQTQPVEMIESPIQSTVVESFDHYPPEPVAPQIAAGPEEMRASSRLDLTGAIHRDEPPQ